MRNYINSVDCATKVLSRFIHPAMDHSTDHHKKLDGDSNNNDLDLDHYRQRLVDTHSYLNNLISGIILSVVQSNNILISVLSLLDENVPAPRSLVWKRFLNRIMKLFNKIDKSIHSYVCLSDRLTKQIDDDDGDGDRCCLIDVGTENERNNK